MATIITYKMFQKNVYQ